MEYSRCCFNCFFFFCVHATVRSLQVSTSKVKWVSVGCGILNGVLSTFITISIGISKFASEIIFDWNFYLSSYFMFIICYAISYLILIVLKAFFKNNIEFKSVMFVSFFVVSAIILDTFIKGWVFTYYN